MTSGNRERPPARESFGSGDRACHATKGRLRAQNRPRRRSPHARSGAHVANEGAHAGKRNLLRDAFGLREELRELDLCEIEHVVEAEILRHEPVIEATKGSEDHRLGKRPYPGYPADDALARKNASNRTARRFVGSLHGREIGVGCDVVGGQQEVSDLGLRAWPVLIGPRLVNE